MSKKRITHHQIIIIFCPIISMLLYLHQLFIRARTHIASMINSNRYFVLYDTTVGEFI